jgi:hypothetical protein
VSERANERSSFINKRIHLKTNFKYKYQNTLLGIRNNKMKINELILEQKQLDELNLKGLGTGLGKAVGAVAGGAVQGAKNIWSGAKQGYDVGQNALKPDGTTNQSGIAQAAQQGYQQGQQALAPNTSPNTAGSSTAVPGNSTGNTAPQPNAQTTAPAAAPAKQGKVGVPAGKQAVDQAVATVQSVRSDRRPQVIQYAKQKVDALAGQAAKPAAPAGPSQAEIDADRARIMGADNGNANESRVITFRSKFLGMDI